MADLRDLYDVYRGYWQQPNYLQTQFDFLWNYGMAGVGAFKTNWKAENDVNWPEYETCYRCGAQVLVSTIDLFKKRGGKNSPVLYGPAYEHKDSNDCVRSLSQQVKALVEKTQRQAKEIGTLQAAVANPPKPLRWWQRRSRNPYAF